MSYTPAAVSKLSQLNNDNGTKISRFAVSPHVDVSNLVLNPVNSTTTITAPGSAPSTTGLTNNFPSTTGFIGLFHGDLTVGSNVISNLSYVGGTGYASITNGMPLVQTGTNNAFPSAIPNGTVATAYNSGNTTVTMSVPATATVSGITIGYWTDKINLIGGIPSAYNTNFAASGSTAGNAVNPPTARTNYTSPFALEFLTDAANFSTSAATIVLSVYQNGASPNSFRVAVDDVYQASSITAFGVGAGTNYLTIQFGNAGVHKVRIELNYGHILLNLWTITGSSIRYPTRTAGKRVAFYGDSFFANGAAGSWPHRNIAAQTAILLGYDYDFLSVGGTGYINVGTTNYAWANQYRIDDTKRRNYDAVVIFGSINDSGANSGTLTPAALAVYTGIRLNAPNIPIFIFGIPATTNLVQSSAAALEAILQSAFASWADANSYFIPVSNDIDGSWFGTGNASVYMAGDGNHPSDPAGTGYLAYLMSQKIKKLLPLSIL